MDNIDSGTEEDSLREKKVTWPHVSSICDDLGSCVKKLGAELKLTSGIVCTVEQDGTSSSDTVWKLLDKWRHREGKDATIGKLENALIAIGEKLIAEKLLDTAKKEAGLNCARTQSARKVDQLRTDPENEQQKFQTTVKDELLTEKGENERQNMERRVKRLETYVSSEKSDKEVLVQETTRLEKICGQMEESLRLVQENIKWISKYRKDLVGRSSQNDSNESEETNEKRLTSRQGKIGVADRTQGATIQLLYEGNQTCLRCSDLEKKLKNINTKNETITTKISELEFEHKEERKKWDEEKKERDKKIKENELEINNLKKTNEKQQKQKERLTKKKTDLEKKNIELVEENEKLVAQREKLMAEKEELEKLHVQTRDKELDRLKAENGQLSAKIEQLEKQVKRSDSEGKKLQEDLQKYINFESRVFLPTGKELSSHCPGVICTLKRDVLAQLFASRSSDGPGKASDIFDHKKGTTSGTKEREYSWWSIDLGVNHRLVVTHYTLRHGKRDRESVLTHWQLEGSNDGANWKKLETNYIVGDPSRSRVPYPYIGTCLVKGKMGAFRYFRIFQTGRNSSHKYGIYLSGIELFGVLLDFRKPKPLES